jgi:hypothetical protein
MEQKTPFPPNHSLLKAVAERFAGNRRIFWLLGASCTGKTTVSKCLAASNNMALCDMDARIFGDYVGKYTETAHPASCAWLKRADALQWALSHSWDEFNRLNEAANVETLDLFSQEVQASTETRPLVVDGGLSHPYLLTHVLPLTNVLCIQRDEAVRAGTWERDENKLHMKSMIQALPDGQQLWRTFLHFDKMITETLEDQCREAGIRIVRTHEGRDVSHVVASVIDCWGLH